MRNTLICTVGTSLITNIKFSKENDFTQAYESKNLQKLALLLTEKPNTDRICGAEINSISSICQKKLIDDYLKLIFLVSDTDDGKQTGQLLKLYYENPKNSLKFDKVEFRVLEGLKDDDVKAFKQQGLKNLVREISKEVRNFSPEAISINATGGYKAQISFAGMIGQALGIPVYYLFEKFSEVIELPPQPVSLDLAFWLNNYPIFELLELESTIEKYKLDEQEIEQINQEYFNSLIDEELIDETSCFSLSAMGVLFNERSRLQFAQQQTAILVLIPKDDTAPEHKKINLRDDHGQDVLERFAKKITRSPYVKEIINSLPFNSKMINPIRRTKQNGQVEFVLTWEDKGYGLCIQTTGRNLAETNTIALHLKEKYAK